MEAAPAEAAIDILKRVGFVRTSVEPCGLEVGDRFRQRALVAESPPASAKGFLEAEVIQWIGHLKRDSELLDGSGQSRGGQQRPAKSAPGLAIAWVDRQRGTKRRAGVVVPTDRVLCPSDLRQKPRVTAVALVQRFPVAQRFGMAALVKGAASVRQRSPFAVVDPRGMWSAIQHRGKHLV